MEAFYFSFVYFSRYPIITADNHYLSEKLVASYRSKTSGELVVAIEDIGQLYTLSRSVLFYTGLQSELSVAERQAFTVGKDVYHFQNTTAQRSCPEIHPTTTYIFSPTLFNECETIPPLVREKAVGLGSPIDSRIYFYIINDTLCDTTLLTHYVYQNSIEMFDTLQLDTTTFCSSWVITQ